MNTKLRNILPLLLSLLFAFNMKAQEIEIWPGDANNNGIVNNIDLLNVGIVFSETGFPRTGRRTGIQFEALHPIVDMENTSIFWDFGDGETSEEANPFHIYDIPGSYPVTLTILGIGQEFCFAFEELVIGVTLTNNCSVIIEPVIDPDTIMTEVSWLATIDATFPFDYFWEFGDVLHGTSNLENPTYDYQDAGHYTTCLTIIDETGTTCTTCIDIVVGSSPSVEDSCIAFISYEGLTGANWEAQFVPDFWQTEFSNNLNTAYADCDGDGEVANIDAEVIVFNYGETHGQVTADEFATGVLGEDIPLLIDSTLIDSFYKSGSLVEIPIILGDELNNLEDFYGLAFSINYDTSLIVAGSMQMEFVLNSWINPDNSTLLSVQKDIYPSGRMELGVTRTDKTTATGFGKIGKISFVIEENVGSFRTINLNIDKIKLINAAEEERIIAGNKVKINIDNTSPTFPPKNNIENNIKIFPNPATKELQIQTKNLDIEKIQLFNSLGQLVLEKGKFDQNKTLQLHQLSSGIYFIKIDTKKGTLTKKLLIQAH